MLMASYLMGKQQLVHDAGARHLLLASASQDKYLRVWRIQPQAASQQPSSSSPSGQAVSTTTSDTTDIAR